MGIHGIYKEIGPGQRIALSKYALEHFEQTGRPLRIAIDISIWLFQIQSGKGGTNPALRTFYYRLLRLISLSIHPLFVFDGPNKPPFKRNKRTGPNVASIPEFLAKQLLKQFGLPFHIAPGEAEAECALIQREGIVDAVLSEDVDTLMFGSGVTFRNWTPEANRNGGPTHVNVYDAKITKAGSRLDREGMILIALMSGGDYIPEGIPGCGPKTACEAARAGFGADLCRISRKDRVALGTWRERLAYELRTNESKFFKQKHGKMVIPEDFPKSDVLGYYTHPCISSPLKVERLRASLNWDQNLDFPELRTFTAEAFDWTKLGGAKKFIRNLAPALLVRELRLRGQDIGDVSSSDLGAVQMREAELITAIHGKRQHVSTDNVTELRVSFKPHNLVPIDLDAEEPDDEIPDDGDSGDEAPLAEDNDNDGEAPVSPSKRRTPPTYDPTQLEKLWIFETYLKVGVPLKVQDWEEALRNPRKYVDLKHTNKDAAKSSKAKKKTTKATKPAMPRGALDRYTRVTKPNQPLNGGKATRSGPTAFSASSLPPEALVGSQIPTLRAAPLPSSSLPAQLTPEVIDLISSSPVRPNLQTSKIPTISSSLEYEIPSTITKRRRTPLRRTQTNPVILNLTGSPDHRSTALNGLHPALRPDSPPSLASPSQLLPTKKARKTIRTILASPEKPSTPSKSRTNQSTETSSPIQQTNILQYFSPSSQHHKNESQKLQTQAPPPFRIASSPPTETLDLTESPGSDYDASASHRYLNEPDGTGGAGRSVRQGLAELDSNLAGSQGDQRNTKTSSNPPSRMRAPPISQQIEELDLTNDSGGLRMPLSKPRSVQTAPKATASNFVASSSQHTAKSKASLLQKKEVIRVRDSFDGAFAIEQIDLSHDDAGSHFTYTKSSFTAQIAPTARRKVFQMSEVGFLDLTGND